AEQLAEEDERVRPLRAQGRGKGLAVRQGMRAARGKVLVEFDADASVPADQLPLVVAAIEQGADIAIGSREAPGARRINEPSYRHLMGRVFNGLVRVLALPDL